MTELKTEIKRQGLEIPVEADGGIGAGNLAEVLACGVDIVVAGSAVFGAEDAMAAVTAMREVEKSLNA